MLGKSPGFTVVAVLTLVLGIGANTAIFTVANTILLRPLPYSDPGRLVLISADPVNQRGQSERLGFTHFTLLQKQQRSLSGFAAFTNEAFNLTGRGDPEQVASARVSWNFFDVLGVRPAMGRSFRQEEDQPGAPQVAVISHEFWMRVFGGARDAIGQTIALNSQDYTVAGVLPPGFVFSVLGSNVDIWAPRVDDLSLATPQQIRRGAKFLGAVGRLRPGISRDQAVAEMEVLLRRYQSEYPANFDATQQRVMQVDGLQEQVVANIRPTLLILLAAVGLVLLIACANVASLLLSRALGRKKEFAVRTALGAPRSMLIRQLLTESLLLAAISGGVGILLGLFGTRFLSMLSKSNLPGVAGVHMDLRVLAFTVAISLLSGVLFGLMPSLQLSRPDLNTVLRDEGRGSTGGRSRANARSLLVVCQVALSMILLVGSGLLVRSFIRLRSASPGFDPKRVLTLQIMLPPARYGTHQQMIAFYNELIQRTRTLPGVEAVTISSALPVNPTHYTPVLFEGQPAVSYGQRPIVNVQAISPDYSKVLRVALVRGREFTAHDDAEAPPVAIVNQALVRRFWPNENPIGKRLWLGSLPNSFDVTGVFGDTKNVNLATAPQPEVFLPFPQLPWALLNLSLRAAVDPHSLISAARRQLSTVDKDQPVTKVQTMDELLESASAQPRFTMFLLGVFSATAFVLAIIGIYGVMAYSVAQRTAELGIRMALGAAKGDILRLVIGQGLSLTSIGLVIGFVASIALTRVMSGLLYQTSATDPITFTASAVVFTAVAIVASYLPARRAARIDPTHALK
jgi:putative ABC transport system permease protein